MVSDFAGDREQPATPTPTATPTSTATNTSTPTTTPTSTATDTSTPTTTPTSTPTQCPQATPEPLWVDPVTSPTDQLSQIVTVRIGNGEAVTVTAESGIFTVTGSFDAYAHPALVNVTLLPNTTHHLRVDARVKVITQGDCTYGGYTLTTTADRFGAPLIIEQQLPTPTSTPTATPTSTPTPVTVQVLAERRLTGYVDSREILSGFFGKADMWTGADTRPQMPRIFHGVTQFDVLDRLPADAHILSAEVELLGRSARYLDPVASGLWSLNLLDSAVDASWARMGFGYWQVHHARVVAAIPPVLSKADVGVGRVNTFQFSETQLAVVQQRLSSTGKLSFRLDGTTPAAYARQIFSWNAWAPPKLRITYAPASR